MDKVIKSWPSDRRPREKLLMRGANALCDAELLALILRTGTREKNAIDLGEELLSRCGGIHQLLEATPRQLTGIKGIGLAKRTQLLAILELARRALATTMRQHTVLSSSSQVKDFLRLLLAQKNYEVFVCLFLDIQNRLIKTEELFRGSISEAAVYPREIVRQALYHNAAALIVAHNHPSGKAKPSEMDIELTRELRQSMQLIDVTLVDHVIVADKAIYSFAEAGLIL